jgi:hypothetical protein
MKKIYCIALSLLFVAVNFCSCSLFETQPDAPPEIAANKEKKENDNFRKRVVLVRFINRSDVGGQDLADYATSIVRDKIEKIPDFILVPEAELENKEAIFSDKQSSQFKDMIAQASENGISAVISGSIDEISMEDSGDPIGIFRNRKFKTIASIKVEVYDVGGSRPLLSKIVASDTVDEKWDFMIDRSANNFTEEREKVAVENALEKVFANFGGYAHRIDWTGRIAKKDVDRFYINGGELTGITKGQLLQVFEEGQSIVNTNSGEVIGFAPGRFKGYLRVIELFGEDGAIGVVQAGGGFQEKDRLRFATAPH